jgi:DNA-binding NarL/FixJ family response regulator
MQYVASTSKIMRRRSSRGGGSGLDSRACAPLTVRGETGLRATNDLQTSSLRRLQTSSLRRSAVIVDPYPLWIEAVSDVVRRIGFDVTGTATTLDEGLQAVVSLKPDLLVLEIEGYAAGNGTSCVSRAREVHRDLRCIVLSSRVDEHVIQGALSAGAAAYVLKVAHAEDLASAVNQAFEHSIYFAPRGDDPTLTLARSPAARTAGEAEAGAAVEPAVLTRREFEILGFVVNGDPNAKIAKTLWITEQTVKFHLSNIFRKLGVSNRTEAARWAHLKGLIQGEPPVLSVVES